MKPAKYAIVLAVFVTGVILTWTAQSDRSFRSLERVELQGPHTTKLVFKNEVETIPTGHVQAELHTQPETIAEHAQEQAWQLQDAYMQGRRDGKEEMRPKKTNLEAMARTMYGEATVMSNMTLVGETVLERVDSQKHPSTIRGVVHEPWAFTSIHTSAQNLDTLNWTDSRPLKWRRARRAAYLTLVLPDSLRELEEGTRHFFSPRSMPEWKPRPYWAEDERPNYVVDNKFEFYRLNHEG